MSEILLGYVDSSFLSAERRGGRRPQKSGMGPSGSRSEDLSSGNLRIARKLQINDQDLSSGIRSCWSGYDLSTDFQPRGIGGFAVTILDTAQRKLQHNEGLKNDDSLEAIEARLRRNNPELFEPMTRLALGRLALFGNLKSENAGVYIGLSFADARVQTEIREVYETTENNILGVYYPETIPEHTAHISIGWAKNHEVGEEIIRRIESKPGSLPESISLDSASVVLK